MKADLSARHPGATLLLAAILTVGAIAGVLRVQPEVDFVDTVPESDNVDAYRELVSRLDGVRFVAIYMASAGGDLRGDDFDALVLEQQDLSAFLASRFPATFSHQLSAYEGMRSGNYMLEKIVTAGNAREESYAFPDDPVRYELVKQQILGDDTLDDVLATDGSSALMLFFFATSDNLEARHLTRDVATALESWSGATVTQENAASGLLYSSQYTDERNGQDLRIWGLVAAGVVAMSLWIVLRRPSNVALALLGSATATAWTFGLMGWSGVRISFLTLFLAPVVIGIGIDAAIHLLHRFEEQGDMAQAVRRIGRPVTLASLTTALGLAVLGFVPNPLFAQIGLVAAIGILLSLLAAFLVVVPLRALLPGKAHPPRPARRLAAWADGVARHPVLAVLAVVALTAGAALGATATRIESGSAENEFPQDDPVIRLQHRIESEYGAFQRAYLIVRGDLTDPAALQAMHAADLTGLPLYRDASSIADLLLADEATDQGAVDIALGGILSGAGQAPSEAQRLPQTRDEARQRLDALFADPLWHTIAPFTITRNYDLAVVAVTLDPWQDQNELRDLDAALDAAAQRLQERLPDHDVQAGGAPSNRAAIIDQTPTNIALATFGVAGTVTLVLAIGWARRGREGLLMAVVAGALVLVAALWLLAAVPALDAAYEITGTANNAALNDMFLLAFAITVAVGVDDVVHLAGRFWDARDRGMDRNEARQDAFLHAGRAVTGTTVTTFLAFAVLGGVYFLQSKNLAILTAAGIAGAYLLAMLIVPLVLRNRQAVQGA